MLVSVAIVAILAVITIPFAEKGVMRAKEMQLRSALRSIRVALDKFYEDCEEGVIARSSPGISRNCYPTDLMVLVEGVLTTDAESRTKRYLRRLPSDPFLPHEIPVDEHWKLRAYEDDIDGLIWGGEDVYDISVTHNQQALNGSYYDQW